AKDTRSACDVAASAARGEADDSDEQTLARQFYDAYRSFVSLVRFEDEPPEQSALDELTGRLKRIASRVMQLRLFSPNEELEDISTTDLKYLMVPYMLAEAAAACRDMEQRLRSLRDALLFWRAFAADCQRLKLGHAADFAAMDREREPSDAAAKREEKIARYKRCKELDEKVAYLFSKKREDLGDEYQWGAGSAFDEEMERELILMLLGRAVASVPDNILSAQQEMPLLEMMIARGGPGKGPAKPPPAEKPYFVKIQDRSELQRLYREMVFRCPHPMATMSIEEAADLEILEMREQEAVRVERQSLQEATEADRWWDGDRYGAKEDWDEEQKLYKDRDFDAFKDENPWGSGNKMANIG
ncbi:unnamed protein product, partial [Effrenium voratum]